MEESVREVTCRVCGIGPTVPLWVLHDCQWSRCLACGSDSSSVDANAVASLYQSNDYVRHLLVELGWDDAIENLRENVKHFGEPKPGENHFLDVGHNEGASLSAMMDEGWSVHGFDVNPHAERSGCTTIAPKFEAKLFSLRFNAVLCREVIEHVDDWWGLLREMVEVTVPGGMIQIQTPRPGTTPNPLPYQLAHLCVFSVAALENAARSFGLIPVHRVIWPIGQCHVFRKPH